MRKGSGIGYRHSHLSKEVGKRVVWALEDGGDTARRAWWMRRGERWKRKGERERGQMKEKCVNQVCFLHSTCASPARSSHMAQLAVRLHPSQPFDIRLEAVPIPT